MPQLKNLTLNDGTSSIVFKPIAGETSTGKVTFLESGTQQYAAKRVLVVRVSAPTGKRKNYLINVMLMTPILSADGVLLDKMYDTRTREVPVTSSPALQEASYSLIGSALGNTDMVLAVRDMEMFA